MTLQARKYVRRMRAPLRRYAEFIGIAAAGIIIVGGVGFALAAMMADLL